MCAGVYDARSRTLAKHMCLLLQIDPDTLVVLEDAIVDELTDDTDDHQPTEYALHYFIIVGHTTRLARL